jgi:hypothetical protein
VKTEALDRFNNMPALVRALFMLIPRSISAPSRRWSTHGQLLA